MRKYYVRFLQKLFVFYVKAYYQKDILTFRLDFKYIGISTREFIFPIRNGYLFLNNYKIYYNVINMRIRWFYESI